MQLHTVLPCNGAHPASIQCITGPQSSRVKGPVCETDSSLPFNSQVTKVWSCKSPPHYIYLHGVY